MSFSFSLSAPERPDYQAVLFGLNLRDVQRLEEEDYLTEGPWPDGVVHFHRPGLSTRGVEVEWSDGEFIIEIPTLAAPEDYDLAFRFIESAATIFGGEVYPEEGESFAVEELRTLYNTEWMIQTNESAIVSIRALLKEEDQILMMFGTVRPFHIGAALLEELDELGPPEEFQYRLIDVMREVQNVDADSFTFAEALQLGKSEEPEETVTMAMWEPEKSYLFPDVDYLLLMDEEERPFFVPYDALPDILDDGWVFIDERQMLVDAIPKEDWAAMLERAAPFAEVPLEE